MSQQLPYPRMFAEQQFYIKTHGIGCLELIEKANEKSHGTYQAQWQVIKKLGALWLERNRQEVITENKEGC